MQAKSSRKNSVHASKVNPGDLKYVLNLTIDMPYFSKCFLSQRHSKQHSPNQIRQNVHFSIAPYSKKSKKSELMYRQATVSHRLKKYSNLTTITKPSYMQTARQTITIAKKKKKTKKIDEKPYKNISVLNLLQREIDDSINIIRYDNSRNDYFEKVLASQKNDKVLADLQPKKFKAESVRVQSSSSDFRLMNILQIRKLQEQAKNSQHLFNAQYVRQKFLIINSVRRIQRAWRRYRTKKLIKSYSCTQDTNYNFCKKNETKSAQKNFFSKKNRKIIFKEKELKFSNLSPSNPQNAQSDNCQVNYQSNVTPIIYNEVDKKKNQQKIMKKLKEFQEQEISSHHNQDQIKRVQLAFKKALAKQQQYKDAQSYQIIDQPQGSNQYMYSSNGSKKSQEQIFNLKKIQYFQQAIQKIDNEVSDISSSSLTPDKLFELEQIENEVMKNKLEFLKQLKQKQQYSQQYNENQFVSDVYERQKEQKKNLQSHKKQKKVSSSLNRDKNDEPELKRSSRQVLLNALIKQQQAIQKQNSIFPQQLIKKIQKLSIMQQLELCKMIGDKLILQGVEDFADSSILKQKIKTSFKKQKNQSSKQQGTLKKQVQSSIPEGICTNLQAMKDYLQNFVTYLLQQQKNLIKQNLSKSAGPTPQILLKYFRKLQEQDLEFIENNYVIPFKYFQQHWKQASDQIYFDVKYLQNQQKQKQRVRYLKGITKIFFRSIFDGFNEALDHERVFGIMGKPYPWRCQICKQHPIHIKNALVLAYKRLASIAQVSCGILIDNSKRQIPQDLLNQIHEAKLNKLLEIEMLQENIRWQFLEDQQAEIRYELSECIYSKLISQVIKQIVTIKDFSLD